MLVRALSLVLALPAVALRHRSAEVNGNETEWPHQGPDAFPAWKLYPFWHTPGKAVDLLKNESFVPGNPADPILIHCLGSNFTIYQRFGYRLDDVSVPALIPFIVPMGQPNRTDAAVVVIPGGGGMHLSFESEGTDMCRWFNSQGISAFLLKYRIPKDSWADGTQIMDVQRAVSLVRSKASSFGLNTSRVGLFGASHGGNLVLHVSSLRWRLYERVDKADDHSYVPDFNVLLYPAAPEAFFHAKEPEVKELFNLTQIPPTFIAVAADDKCIRVESILELYKAMHEGDGDARHNNNTELHLYPTGGHAFGLCYRRSLDWMQEQAVCGWTSKAVSFLQRKVLLNSSEVTPLYWMLRGALNVASVK